MINNGALTGRTEGDFYAQLGEESSGQLLSQHALYAPADLLLEVLQGSTVIATRTITPQQANWYDAALTLTTSEAGAVTDASALRVRVTRLAGGMGSDVADLVLSVTGTEVVIDGGTIPVA